MKIWGCEIEMKIERPEEGEMQELYDEFGKPEIKEEEVSLTSLEYTGDYPPCKGEAVLEIHKDRKIVGVRHKGGDKFVLPMGRIWKDESILEGAKREAKEETGLEVDIKELKEIWKVDFQFSNAELERWHLLFRAEATGEKLKPEDEEEIAEVGLFEGEWYWTKGVYSLRR